MSYQLALSLLVLRSDTDNVDFSSTLHNFAFRTNFLDGCSYFHLCNLIF